MQYRIVSHNEDGTRFSEPMDRQQLLSVLKENYVDPVFLEEIPTGMAAERDWGGIVILRCEVVVPLPKRTVTEWEIPSS